MGCGPSTQEIERDVRYRIAQDQKEFKKLMRQNYEAVEEAVNKKLSGVTEYDVISWYRRMILMQLKRLAEKIYVHWDGKLMVPYNQSQPPRILDRECHGILMYDAASADWLPESYCQCRMDGEWDRFLPQPEPISFAMLRFEMPFVVSFQINERGHIMGLENWTADEVICTKKDAIREQDKTFRMINNRRRYPLSRCLVNYIGKFLFDPGNPIRWKR